MRLHSCQCKAYIMAASIQYPDFTYSPTLTNPLGLPKVPANPPRQISKFTLKPIKIFSLKALCNHGKLKEALFSFTNLFTEDQDPPQFVLDEAYSSLFELCASKKSIALGRQFHAHLIKCGAVYDAVFLSTRLVFMYGKCGDVSSAEKLFDRMPERTIFSWNAIIGAFVSTGEPLLALQLYHEMRISGFPLDSCTFPCILKACGMIKDVNSGAEIHGLAIKCGYNSVDFVVNSLVSMYAKCNNVNGARRLFERMTEREDVVLWNSIISAYASNGEPAEAWRLFKEMHEVCPAKNTYTFVAAVQACEMLSLNEPGMVIHAAVMKSGFFLDLFVANALIVMYARLGRMGDAEKVFERVDEKDNISWNSMLTGYVQNGLCNEAVQFFHYMQDAGQKPDQVSLINIAAVAGRLGNVVNGMETHAYAIKRRFDRELQVGNTFMDMYAKCYCVNYMNRVFQMMPDRDIISWTTVIAGNAQNNCYSKAVELFVEVQMQGMDVDEMMMGSILLACSFSKHLSHVKEIHGNILRKGLSDLVLQNSILDVYGQCGDMDYASRMFELIEGKDVVSWTSMISCCTYNGNSNKALEYFCLMEQAGIEPDYISLLSVLSAAASLSALKKGKEIHGYLIRKCFVIVGSIASALVDMYAHCGALENSYKVFGCVKDKDLVLWTSMISANGMHGRGGEAIYLFGRMMRENIMPDHIVFLSLLYACSHSGLVDQGKRFLEIMEHQFQLEPWPEHYACVVDLLGRANHLEEAYQFVRNIHFEPTAAIWCALLGACRVHSNQEIGEVAAKKLLELDPDHSGNYVLISNVYAATGRWKDADEVRMKMKGKGLKKVPGCSWIEVGNKVHTFMARDRSHPQSDEIYAKLALITNKLAKDGGYLAQTKFVLQNVTEEEKVQILYGHSERLAIAYGLIGTPQEAPMRITKNLRVCGDCHTFSKLVSKFFERDIVVRDANRFHHFQDGVCSCGDFW